MSDLPNMTVQDFLRTAEEIRELVPGHAELVKNQVGNLAIVVDGEYWGWIDLRYGGVSEARHE